jgi:hypothetical protein
MSKTEQIFKHELLKKKFLKPHKQYANYNFTLFPFYLKTNSNSLLKLFRFYVKKDQ